MKKNQFTYHEIALFCQEMALMLHAGIGTPEGLGLLAEEETNAHWRAILTKMAEQADQGLPFSEIIRNTEGFPSYMTGLIDMGDRTGRLEEALTSLASYYEEQERIDQRIRSVLLYPSILFLLMLAVIVVLLTKVLPMFRSVYASLGGEMTGIAGLLLQIGLGLNQAMPVLCVLFAVLILFLLFFSSSKAFRDRVLHIWRAHAGDRGAMRAMNDACFAQAFSMGLSSGLPLEDTLELAAQVLSDIPTAQQRCLTCKDALEHGSSFSDALSAANLFPAFARRLLTLGMQAGSGDSAMQDIARRLSEEADLALHKNVSRVEPALVLIGSVLVGAILLSVMLPIIDIMEVIA